MWKTILNQIGIEVVAKELRVSESAVKMWVYSGHQPSRYKIPGLVEIVGKHCPDQLQEFKDSISKDYLGE
jgi:hypothetical protein